MNKYIDLTSKVALVTGGSSGIGRATAIVLAACGARLSINYNHNEAGATEARQQIRSAGGQAIAIQGDVTRAIDVRALVQRTVEEFGPIEILVNNAGSLVERRRILEMNEELWDEVIDFTKGLAKELGPHGVRVNAVSPGVIDTPFHQQFSTPDMMKAYVNMIPLGRIGSSEEVGKVIAFLASDAASFLSGETIEVNGGMLML